MRNDHPEGHGVKACLEAPSPDGQCWFPEGDNMRAALLENGMKAEGHGTKVGWRLYPERAACPEGYGWRPRPENATCPEASYPERAACPEASYPYGNGWRAFFPEGDHVRSARLEGEGVRNVVEWCADIN